MRRVPRRAATDGQPPWGGGPGSTRGLASLLLVALASSPTAAQTQHNGFDLEPSLIPLAEILHGGPPRDGIPALDAPATSSAAEAVWRDDERVVGVQVGGETRAYPLALLEWHELVNDRLGDTPILVSYCPLCATALVFDRRIGGEALRFGVSGLLHRSDLLMFDRASESLWSQIMARAVTGPRAGQSLTLLRSKLVRWGDWKRAHPETSVVSLQTGHSRPYGRSPYGEYAQSDTLYFPVRRDPRHPLKEPTLGLRTPAGAARAYPATEVQRAGGRVVERFAGHPVEIRWDASTRSFDAHAPETVEIVEGYWFAWVAFHPQTSVYSADSVLKPASGEDDPSSEGSAKSRGP